MEQSFVRPHPATTLKGESFPILIPFFYTHTQLAQYYPFCQSRKPLTILFFFMSHQALCEKVMCRLVMSQKLEESTHNTLFDETKTKLLVSSSKPRIHKRFPWIYKEITRIHQRKNLTKICILLIWKLNCLWRLQCI